MLDNLIIAASIANLMLMWDWLYAFDSVSVVHATHFISANGAIAFFLVFLAYFFFFFLLLRTALKQSSWLAKTLLLIPFGLLFLSFISLRNFFSLASSYPAFFSPSMILGNWGQLNPVKYFLFLMPLLFLYWKNFPAAKKLFKGVFLVLSPFLILTFGKLLLTQSQSIREKKEPTSFTQSPLNTKKTLWLVFDAFDYNYTFNIKETDFTYPEITRFRNSSFSFSHAIAPTPRTLFTMSSYFFGKTATFLSVESKSSTQIKFTEEKSLLPMYLLPNLFKSAKIAGNSTAIIGWHVPYCRLFEKETDYCVWFSSLQWPYQGSVYQNFISVLRHSLRKDIEVPIVRRRLHDLTVEKTLSLVEKNLPNLTLVHFPVPHEPGINEPEKYDSLSESEKVIKGYYDNLKLVDFALGQIRASLEKKNAWNDTNIIVTSDHWLRYAPKEYKDKYGRDLFEVPLMVKLAGTNSAFEYDKPISTLPIATLLLGTLDGSFADEKSLHAWADQHAVTDRKILIDQAAATALEIGWLD